MFAQLLASRVVRRRSLTGVATSVMVHAIVLFGAAVLSAHARAHPLTAHEGLVSLVSPAPVRRAPAPLRPAGRLLPHIGIINVPVTVPDFIPPVDLLRAAVNTDEPFEFRIGTPSRAGDPSAPASVPDEIFRDVQVEVPVAIDPRSPLPRYPQLLRERGVEGFVRLRFVVDTSGRAEPATVQVVESTHQAFTVAAQASVFQLRFLPARIGDHRVRQLVEFPLYFRLNR